FSSSTWPLATARAMAILRQSAIVVFLPREGSFVRPRGHCGQAGWAGQRKPTGTRRGRVRHSPDPARLGNGPVTPLGRRGTEPGGSRRLGPERRAEAGGGRRNGRPSQEGVLLGHSQRWIRPHGTTAPTAPSGGASVASSCFTR